MGRVLYVAGYGRSGSTVLDVLLGSHPRICSVGELAFLPEDLTLSGRRCACGAAYASCEFWSAVLRDAELADPSEALVRRLRRVESRRGLVRLIAGRVDGEDARAYGALYRRLLERVRERSGCSLVVDSSKSAGWTAARPLALERLAGQEVYLLHLVRGGADTVRSLVRHGSNWAAEGRREPRRMPALRTAAGWTLAHLGARSVGRRLPPERRLRVRYERLVAEPVETLARIGDWIGLDLRDLGRRAAAGETFAVGHNVGGNRLRRGGPVRLWRPEERAREAERPRLRHRLLFGAIGGWLELRLRREPW